MTPGCTDVLVVDDHPLIAETLASALRAAGLTVSRCPDTDAHAVRQSVATTAPRLVVLDLDLGDGQRGENLVPQLRQLGAEVLVLTGSADPLAIGGALAAGAMGWLSKTAAFSDLVRGVVAATQGAAVTPPKQRMAMITAWRQAESNGRRLRERFARLSPREREVLCRLAHGCRAEVLARDLVVTIATIRSQIRSILLKLEVGSQLEAAALAHQMGFGDEREAS